MAPRSSCFYWQLWHSKLLNLFAFSIKCGLFTINRNQSVKLSRHKRYPRMIFLTNVLLFTRLLPTDWQKRWSEILSWTISAFRPSSLRQQCFLQSRLFSSSHFEFFNFQINLVDRNAVFWVTHFYISEAFDRVPQSHIISGVSSFRKTDPLPSWLSSCSTKMSAVDSIDGIAFNARNATGGVVKESVLGPRNTVCTLKTHGIQYLTFPFLCAGFKNLVPLSPMELVLRSKKPVLPCLFRTVGLLPG